MGIVRSPRGLPRFLRLPVLEALEESLGGCAVDDPLAGVTETFGVIDPGQQVHRAGCRVGAKLARHLAAEQTPGLG